MFPRALLQPVNPPLSRQNDPVADLRVTVRVKPGASRTRVGGVYGEGELIVAVNSPPVDGAADEDGYLVGRLISSTKIRATYLEAGSDQAALVTNLTKASRASRR